MLQVVKRRNKEQSTVPICVQLGPDVKGHDWLFILCNGSGYYKNTLHSKPFYNLIDMV